MTADMVPSFPLGDTTVLWSPAFRSRNSSCYASLEYDSWYGSQLLALGGKFAVFPASRSRIQHLLWILSRQSSSYNSPSIKQLLYILPVPNRIPIIVLLRKSVAACSPFDRTSAIHPLLILQLLWFVRHRRAAMVPLPIDQRQCAPRNLHEVV